MLGLVESPYLWSGFIGDGIGGLSLSVKQPYQSSGAGMDGPACVENISNGTGAIS